MDTLVLIGAFLSGIMVTVLAVCLRRPARPAPAPINPLDDLSEEDELAILAWDQYVAVLARRGEQAPEPPPLVEIDADAARCELSIRFRQRLPSEASKEAWSAACNALSEA